MPYLLRGDIDIRWQAALEWDVDDDFFLAHGDRERYPTLLNASMIPKGAILPTKRKQLPDFCLLDAWIVVSERVYQFLDQLEPGRNQYIPITVRRKRGSPILGPDGSILDSPYYIMNVMQRIDAVLPHLSKLEDDKRQVYEQTGLVQARMSYYDDQLPLVYDRKMIAGHHVWEGINHMRGMIALSDHVGDWIKSHRMRGCRLWKVGEA